MGGGGGKWFGVSVTHVAAAWCRPRELTRSPNTGLLYIGSLHPHVAGTVLSLGFHLQCPSDLGLAVSNRNLEKSVAMWIPPSSPDFGFGDDI